MTNCMRNFIQLCRLCGSNKFKYFLKKNGFTIERCQNCGLVQVADDLTEVQPEDYYGQEFFDSAYSWLIDESKGRNKEYAKFNYRMKKIEKRGSL